MGRANFRETGGLWMLDSAPADPANPTVAEISAGTSLLGVAGGEALADLDGWGSSVDEIEVPDAVSPQTGTIAGEEKLGTGRLDYYIDKVANPISDVLQKGVERWVVLAPVSRTGTAGDEVSTFSVRVQKNQPNVQVANAGVIRQIFLSKAEQYDNGAILA